MALTAPLAARAASGDYSLLVTGPGDQTDPSIDAQYVVYASNVSGSWDVLRCQITDGSVAEIAGGLGNKEPQPDVSLTNVIYRGPDGIWIRNWDLIDVVRNPLYPPGGQPACAFDAPVSNPTIGDQVAAWECARPDGTRDIAVFRIVPVPQEYLLVRPGVADGAAVDQHAPAAFGSLVAFVDEADGGSVWLHDSDPQHGGTVLVCPGHATGVSVGSSGGTVLAVARASQGHDHDIEVWRVGDDTKLAATLRVNGEQQNPHISLDWVAFEDLSTGKSQVVLWQWTTDIVYVPHPSESNQTLNDLSVAPGTEVRVVFADDASGNKDIALYRLLLDGGKPPDDVTSNWPPAAVRPPPASCDDPDPVVLATLVLGRDTGKPRADSISFEAAPFPGDTVLPVLVCIDADRVSSAWVAFDDQAVAMPGDFEPSVTRLALPAQADPGRARISGVMAGKPGSSLVARVLADPGRLQPAGASPAPASPAPAPRSAERSGGCGSAPDAAGSLGAALALLMMLRLKRRG